MARPYPETDRCGYMDITRLGNREGTGFLPRLPDCERGIFDLTEESLTLPLHPEELAAFQHRMAEKALAILPGIS